MARYCELVGESRDQREPIASSMTTIADLAREQHAEPVADPSELAADIWESDAELEEFLADLRATRQASLG
jgi:hypothetical protein